MGPRAAAFYKLRERTQRRSDDDALRLVHRRREERYSERAHEERLRRYRMSAQNWKGVPVKDWTPADGNKFEWILAEAARIRAAQESPVNPPAQRWHKVR